MNCSRISDLETLAQALIRGASLELYLTPKPGLVDLANRGSHPDLSISTMERSIRILADYLDEMTASLIRGEAFIEQRNIAIRTERYLLDALKTNTHKGYVFLSGMLLIARWHAAASGEKALRLALSTLAKDYFKTGEMHLSNGRLAREKYGAGGIVLESMHAFPSVFEEALPAFRASMKQRGCFIAASFAMLARLMQTIDDTTTLHRGGPPGLARIKRDGLRLQNLIAQGGNYTAYLNALNRTYVRLNLTIGGIADMLGIAYGYLIAQGEISAANHARQYARPTPHSPELAQFS